MIYRNMLTPYYINNLGKNINQNRFYNNYVNFCEQQVPVNQEVGFVELFVFTNRGQIPIENATVTVYARQTILVGTPIRTLTTKKDPIIIELPVAHPSGTLIRGPEYYFTTYNLTISAPGYSPVTILNIRIFPGVTEKLDINMYEIQPGAPITEKIINIPPHPRDQV